ncbi:CD209 antigen-like protein E [Poecilia formosa]|uniref:CD209 antigen-like protein E n=1 Tax=Poecilia formosa TaxID=48698 RepID=UPI0007BAC936|nr:PREDICTED: CD209 antigen-like protein E [Poecilia formosa]
MKCEPGWEPHGGNCYYFSTTKSSWTDSRRSCTDLGSDLVKIDSREEQTFLMRKVREKINGVNEIIWIGLTAVKTEGSWLWVNGSPLNTSFLGPNQPDCAGGRTHDCNNKMVCGRMMKTTNSDLVWLDGYCDDYLRSICVKAA